MCADGSGSSCVDLLLSAIGSGGGSGSSEPAELEGADGDRSMQLGRDETKKMCHQDRCLLFFFLFS